MLLEVSASPKPGNVDREHDFPGTMYEHFLASAVAVYPVLDAASRETKGMGKLIRLANEESKKWQRGGNTHFGTLLLLIPLVMAAGASERYDDVGVKADEIVRATTVEDTMELYRAFQIANVRVREVDNLDVYDKESIEKIRRNGIKLYDIMKLSSSYDSISKELTNGFPFSFRYASVITEKSKGMDINDAIVYTYLKILSENKDTFVSAKFGEEKAEEVSKMASEILTDFDGERIADLDMRLIEEGINPGSTADIMAGALFLALLRGLRF
jgi:triphosphoribosyl-dephospho-CoA synthase